MAVNPVALTVKAPVAMGVLVNLSGEVVSGFALVPSTTPIAVAAGLPVSVTLAPTVVEVCAMLVAVGVPMAGKRSVVNVASLV